MQQTQGSLLYVWSPRMVLSAQHAASAQRQALVQGLRFVPLHDAGVPRAEVQAALERLRGWGVNAAGSPSTVSQATSISPTSPGSSYRFTVAKPAQDIPHIRSADALATSQPLCAKSLLERDALRHFPTAFVVQASGVHRYPIVGAMPDSAWASSIAQRIKVVVSQRPDPSVSHCAAPTIDALAEPPGKALAQERTGRIERSEALR